MLRRRTLVIAAVLSVLAFAAYELYQFNVELRFIGPVYEAIHVINEVIKYVDTHEGRWPRSWDDLPNADLSKLRTRMRFDVDVPELIRDPQKLRAAIQPLRSYYRVFPHSDAYYEDLRFALEDGGNPKLERRNIERPR